MPGEVEVPAFKADGTPWTDPSTGLCYKYTWPDLIRAAATEKPDRVPKSLWGPYSAKGSVLQRIALRAVPEREVPPGYSGPPGGPVVVQLRPGIRYYQDDGETVEGLVSSHPDEAVQLVRCGAATYPS